MEHCHQSALGPMNPDDFRDHMLSLLFLRYLSDTYEAAAEKALGMDYPTVVTDSSLIPLEVCYAANADDVPAFEKQMRRKVRLSHCQSSDRGTKALLKMITVHLNLAGCGFQCVAAPVRRLSPPARQTRFARRRCCRWRLKKPRLLPAVRRSGWRDPPGFWACSPTWPRPP